MPSLAGTYVNEAQNFTLVIAEANDSNGTASGTMNWGPHAVPVKISYHFKNSVGPETCLAVVGNTDDPNKFFGGSGYTSNANYSSIQIGMSLATENRVDTFSTRLDRK